MEAGIGIREILNQNNRLLPEVVRLSASGRVQYIALVNSLSYPLCMYRSIKFTADRLNTLVIQVTV